MKNSSYRQWMERFEIRQKVDTGRWYVVDKADDRFVKNFTLYCYRHEAVFAAGNYYRAEQRAIEKALLNVD